MANVIVDLRSIRIEIDEYIVTAFHKGDEKAQAQVYFEVEEKIKEILSQNFIGDGLIERLEVDEDE